MSRVSKPISRNWVLTFIIPTPHPPLPWSPFSHWRRLIYAVLSTTAPVDPDATHRPTGSTPSRLSS